MGPATSHFRPLPIPPSDDPDFVAVRGEGVGHGLIHDNQGSAGRECPPDCAEDLDRSGHVVDALERGHQIAADHHELFLASGLYDYG